MRSERFPAGSGKLEPGEDRLGETLAAAAGEGEGVDQRRAELLLHLLLNLAAGAVQACLNRLRLDAEELRRLLNAHAFDEAPDQNGAEGLRQGVDGALQKRADFALGHRGFRIELGMGKGEADDLSARFLRVGAGLESDRRLAAAQPPQRL